METYHLWHGPRQGWVMQSGTTTSELSHAGFFSADEARRRVERSRDHQGNITIIPVRCEDVA